MRRFLMLAMALTLCVLPIQAQEGCDISLLDDISKLVEAQDAGDNGDTATALAIIGEVQSELDALVAACAQGDASLPATFEFPDGLFRFNHPDDWAVMSPISGVYVLGNNQSAVNDIVESNIGEAIPPGTRIIITAYGDMKSLFNANSFADLVDQLQETGMASAAQFASPENIVINDYPGVQLAMVSDLFDGTLYLLDLGADNKIAMFVALTPSGEFDDFQPTFEDIVHSMDVGRKQESEGQSKPPSTEITPNTGISLSDVTYQPPLNIRDLIEAVDWSTAALAPDGTRIAWFNRRDDGGICLYEFADESIECQALPEIFGSVALLLLWSPDSRFIAFTQDGLRRFHEPDIWVFNTETNIFTNRTDDNINRWRFSGDVSPGDSPGPLWFDHTFTWGPDGMIYFVRLNAPDSTDISEATTGLYRVAPESGASELIRNLTSDLERLSIYHQQQYDLNGAMAVSPDATQIAFIVLEPKLDSPHNGVWVMPLSGDEAPQQIIRASDLVDGNIEGFSESGYFLLPMGIAWTPDQHGLYLFASNPQLTTSTASVVYHIDIASGTLTPLTDFSGYTPADLFKVDDTTGHTRAFYVPRGVVMSPDGTTPLMFHTEPGGGIGGLSTLTLSADGGIEIETLLEFEYKPIPGQHASGAADGKLLIWGALFLPQE